MRPRRVPLVTPDLGRGAIEAAFKHGLERACLLPPSYVKCFLAALIVTGFVAAFTLPFVWASTRLSEAAKIALSIVEVLLVFGLVFVLTRTSRRCAELRLYETRIAQGYSDAEARMEVQHRRAMRRMRTRQRRRRGGLAIRIG